MTARPHERDNAARPSAGDGLRAWVRDRNLGEFGALLSVCSTAVSIVLAFSSSLPNFLGQKATGVIWLVLLSAVVVGLVISLSSLLAQSARREAALEEGLKTLDRLQAHAEVPVALAIKRFATLAHDAQEKEWAHSHGTPEELNAQIQELLANFVKAYEVISRLTYRASIKYFQSVVLDGQELSVARTIARSGGLEPDIDTNDLIIIRDNTAFETVHTTRGTHFFSNDLIGLSEQGLYSNTRKGWQTRYRSAIVWKLEDQAGCFGVCCVDSVEVNAFEELRDVNLGWCFVDAVKKLARVRMEQIEIAENGGT